MKNDRSAAVTTVRLILMLFYLGVTKCVPVPGVAVESPRLLFAGKQKREECQGPTYAPAVPKPFG